MSCSVFGIYGASGFGREVMPVARLQQEAQGAEIVFIDDSCRVEGQLINEHRLFSYDGFLNLKAGKHFVALAIADGKIRKALSGKCDRDGIFPWAIRADNVITLDNVVIGEGAVLCPFSMLTSNIVIGKGFHANIYSYVAHDCVIGDYVTFAPGVKCNGNIVIEDYAYIGTGAVIKQGRPGVPLTIGRGAVVGMGAVVTKDVPPGAVVVGNPAKPLNKN